MSAATLLTPVEAAAMARCNVNTVYGALQAGELAGFQRRKPKGRWLIEVEAVDRWVRGQ